MQPLENRTVREVASADPRAARIFEKFGIDYCCGGEKSLAQACSAANVSVRQVAEALEKPSAEEDARDWQKTSLAELIRHIVEKHHGYVQQEIQRSHFSPRWSECTEKTTRSSRRSNRYSRRSRTN